MAYLLGYIYADGSLEDASYLRGKYFRASSIDKEMIDYIKREFGSGHTVSKLQPTTVGGSVRYFIRIGDHGLFDSLVALGLSPNKSLTMQFPKVPRNYISDFVRGYFDGDGCVYFEHGKGSRGQAIIKRVVVVFTSGSPRFLKQLSNTLSHQCVFKHAAVLHSHRSSQLRFGAGDSIELFKFMYGNRPRLYLRRKAAVFCNYLYQRPTRVDKKVENVLSYLQ